MPTVVNWINEANNQGMKYREHITWVKRNITPSGRLSRCQESIFIYGDRSKFYETRGPFEDVKIPGILFDVATIEGIQRAYQEAQSIISGKTLKNARGHKRQEVFSRFGNQQIMTRHSPTANYTNVWSFLPPQYSKGRCMSGENHHPTEKPIEIMKRLIEMLVPENGVVLDPFGGTSTTAIAAINTNRNYILIEKELEYFELSLERIAKHSPKDYSVIPDNPTIDKDGQLNLF
jgi:site-specific DNA-methyltransferase (adenine-specific)